MQAVITVSHKTYFAGMQLYFNAIIIYLNIYFSIFQIPVCNFA